MADLKRELNLLYEYLNDHYRNFDIQEERRERFQRRNEIQTFLLQNEIKVDSSDPACYQLLYEASMSGDIGTVKMLVDLGANLNQQDENGDSMLTLICRYGEEEELGMTVKYLLELGADMTLKNLAGECPLFKACVENLHLFGTDTKPEHCSIGCYSQELIKILLSHGKSLGKNFNKYYTFIEYAIMFEKQESQRYDYDIKYLTQLLNDGNMKIYLESLLSFAVGLNCEKVAEMLLDKGACINYDGKDKYKPTPVLSLAAKYSTTNMMLMLLKRGAEVDAVDFDGLSPLHYACESNDSKKVKLLLDYKTQVNVVDKNNVTPLYRLFRFWLVDYKYEILEIAKILFLNGADPNILQKNCLMSPLESLFELDVPADILKLFIDHGADLKRVDEYGITLLHRVARRPNDSVACLLEENIFNANVQDIYGNTPLNGDFLRAQNSLFQINCYNFVTLLQNGGDVNILNKNGKAPILEQDCSYEDDFCQAQLYLRKLEFLGYEVNEQTKASFHDYDYDHEESLEMYRAESEVLEEVIITILPKITLYDYLFLKRQFSTTLVTNIVLTDLFEKNYGDFRNKFYEFGEILNLRLKRSQERNELFVTAIEVFEKLLGTHVDVSFTREIFKYLNANQLEAFNLVKNFKVE